MVSSFELTFFVFTVQGCGGAGLTQKGACSEPVTGRAQSHGRCRLRQLFEGSKLRPGIKGVLAVGTKDGTLSETVAGAGL